MIVGCLHMCTVSGVVHMVLHLAFSVEHQIVADSQTHGIGMYHTGIASHVTTIIIYAGAIKPESCTKCILYCKLVYFAKLATAALINVTLRVYLYAITHTSSISVAVINYD